MNRVHHAAVPRAKSSRSIASCRLNRSSICSTSCGGRQQSIDNFLTGATSNTFNHLVLLLAVLFTFSVTIVTAPLPPDATPDFIKPCQRNDPQINGCIKEAFEHLKPYLHQGIPEIKLASIEPLRIPKMTMENGAGAVRVRAVFSNITVYGATNYTILNVKGNVTNYKMELSLSIPRIEVTGSYDVNGNVLLFPVRSRGDFWALFSNITGVGKIYGKEVIKSGISFMKTERLGVDFKLQKSRFRIRDQLNGNNVIGEAMNHFLNQNSNEIIEEMKPAAAQAISKHFKNFLNGAFLQVPISVWLKS